MKKLTKLLALVLVAIMLAAMPGFTSAASVLTLFGVNGSVELEGRDAKIIKMDGKFYSVNELEPLVFSDDVDLTKVISVGDTEFTLGDLKLMIEIDNEANYVGRRLKEINGFMTPEHYKTMQNLREAIASDALVMAGPDYEENDLSEPNITVSVTPSVTVPYYGNGSASSAGAVFVTVSLYGDAPVGGVTMKYKTIDGSAKAGVNFTGVTEQTLTLTQLEPNKNVRIQTILPGENYKAWIGGAYSFVVRFYDITGAKFENGAQAASAKVFLTNTANPDSYPAPSGYNMVNNDKLFGKKQSLFAGAFQWNNGYDFQLRHLTSDENGGNIPTGDGYNMWVNSQNVPKVFDWSIISPYGTPTSIIDGTPVSTMSDAEIPSRNHESQYRLDQYGAYAQSKSCYDPLIPKIAKIQGTVSISGYEKAQIALGNPLFGQYEFYTKDSGNPEYERYDSAPRDYTRIGYKIWYLSPQASESDVMTLKFNDNIATQYNFDGTSRPGSVIGNIRHIQLADFSRPEVAAEFTNAQTMQFSWDAITNGKTECDAVAAYFLGAGDTIPRDFFIVGNFNVGLRFTHKGTDDAPTPATPKLVSVTAPDGTYGPGEVIPITVEYDRVVKPTGTGIVVNGTPLTAEANGAGTYNGGLYLTYFYTVPTFGNASLTVDNFTDIAEVQGFASVKGQGMESGLGKTTLTFDNITLVGDKSLAFTGIEADKSAYGLAGGNTNVTVTINLTSEQDKKLWIFQPNALNNIKVGYNGYFYSAELVKNDFGATDESKLKAVIQIPTEDFINYGGTSKTLRLFLDGKPISGKTREINLNAPIFAASVSIAPQNMTNGTGMYVTQADAPKLVATVNPADSDFKTVTFASSDPSVATITTNGTIQPKTAGSVTFTATAANINAALGSPGASVSESITCAVMDGGDPALIFPRGADEIKVRKGDAALVVWSSNAHLKGEDIPYEVKVYETNDGVTKGELKHTSAAIEAKTEYTIPAGVLSNVSGANASYLAEVSARKPYTTTGEVLTATAKIIVLPRPLTAKLARPANLYITDAANSFNFAWNLDNYEPTDGGFEVTVVNNDKTAPSPMNAAASGVSASFDVRKVPDGQLKDIYIVTLKARNSTADAWSTDSFIVWVYSDGALKIMLDGVSSSSAYKLSNIADIVGKTSDQILALNRGIALKSGISINSDEYAWGFVDDMIKWSSSDNSAATINYQQGFYYDNIDILDYAMYPPSTEFMLAGRADGTTTATAEHGKVAGLKDSVSVTVETLKDKLYLLNILPKTGVIDVSYTNGDGVKKQTRTNAVGQIAIYEESGIVGSVHLKGVSGDDKYLGSVPAEALLTGEGDASKYALYPMNTVKMKKVSTVEFYFKKPDGTPYSGNITYGGGVYKNGSYCSPSQVDDQTAASGADGKVTIDFDATTYYISEKGETHETELYATDDLEFKFEVKLADDIYYPMILTSRSYASEEVNIRFSTGIVMLRSVPTGEKYKPFVSNQSVDDFGAVIDLINYDGVIGPNNHYPSAELKTIVMWWGDDEASEGHNVVITDENGKVLNTQKKKFMKYPFSTIAITENNLTLTDNSGIAREEKTRLKFNLYEADGSLARRINSTYQATNAVGIEDITKVGALSPLKASDTDKTKGNPSILSKESGLIGGAAGLIVDTVTDNPFFKLLIIPTKNPYEYEIVGYLGADFLGMDDSANLAPTIKSKASANATTVIAALKSIAASNPGKSFKDSMNDALASTSGVDKGARLSGYLVGRASFNGSIDKWKMRIVEMGLTAGASVGYHWTHNSMVGPIPVTAELALGVAVEFDVKNVDAPDSDYDSTDPIISDTLLTLRINAYIRGFAGFGFDFTVVALKIGLFGSINLTNYNQFLKHGSNSFIDGEYVRLDGTVGIEFVAKIVLVNYRAVLTSKTYTMAEEKFQMWDTIQRWVKDANLHDVGGNPTPITPKTAMLGMSSQVEHYQEVYSEAVMESRDYIAENPRRWNGGAPSRTRALDQNNTFADIQTNAYPYTTPQLTDDGSLMIFVHDGDSTDLNDTSIYFSRFEAGKYGMPAPIVTPQNGKATPENNPSLAGNGAFAVAAWEHQAERIAKEGGETATSADLVQMLNSSEIYAGIWNGSAWAVTPLTTNHAADISPIVATNGKDGANARAVVVYRRAAGNNPENITDFSAQDELYYRYYNGANWGEEKLLTSGATRGIDVSMTSGGEAIAAYILGEGGAETQEAWYSVIDTNGGASIPIRRTCDNDLDENIKTTVVKIDGAEQFLMAWHNVTRNIADGSSKQDIMLQIVEPDGTLYQNFPASLSVATKNSAVTVGSEFEFARNAGKTLDGLALVWKASVAEEYTPNADFEAYPNGNAGGGVSEAAKLEGAARDAILAVKFYTYGQGRVGITSAQELAKMPSSTVVNSFGAYMQADGVTLKAAIAATEYKDDYEQIVLDGGQAVFVAKSESKMLSATEKFEDKLDIKGVEYNMADAIRGNSMPIQFIVANKGYRPTTSLEVTINGQELVTSTEPLNPDGKADLTAFYDIPVSKDQALPILNYAVTANFGGEPVTQTGTIDLNIADVSIAQFETISEENAERVVELLLVNGSDGKLS